MSSILLQHGIMFTHITTEKGHSRIIPVAIGVFKHHGDGLTARVAIGFTREAAVANLQNEHNPTEIVYDMDDLRNFAKQQGMDLNDPVGSLPEFSARVEQEFISNS